MLQGNNFTYIIKLGHIGSLFLSNKQKVIVAFIINHIFYKLEINYEIKIENDQLQLNYILIQYSSCKSLT